MSLTVSLLNAVSGLHLNQAALDVISNNITNVNTPGYSRKTLEQQARVLDGRSAGVDIANISRTVNDALLRDLRVQNSAVSSSAAQAAFFDRMSEMFGTLADNNNISARLTGLGSAFEALAATPESAVARMNVINNALSVTQQLNTMAVDTQNLRLDADQQITTSVNRINQLLTEINELNQQVSRSIALGQSTADLEDQRDLALNQLAEEVDITYFNRPSGEVVVLTTGGRTLLDRVPIPLTHNPAAAMSATVSYPGSGIDGINLGGTDITSEIRDGRLAGLIAQRDRILPDFQTQLDTLTAMLRDQVNALHNGGTGLPSASSLTGSRVFGDPSQDIFQGSGTVRIALLDSNGNFAPGTPPANADFLDLDLTALGPVTIDTLAATITAGLTNINATVTAATDGSLQLTGTGGFRVAILDVGTAETTTGESFSTYFGLNDLITSNKDFSSYSSNRQTAATTPLGSAGQLTITFDGMAAPATVNYLATDDLATFAANVTAAIAAQGGNATASVVADGDGVRLVLNDPDGDTLHLRETGGGSVFTGLGMHTSINNISSTVGVRADIAANPELLSRGALTAGAPLVGEPGVTIGNNAIAQQLADVFNQGLVFTPAGGLPLLNTTLSGYGANMLSLNASQAQAVEDTLAFQTTLQQDLSTKHIATSGVNLDEELANLTLFQNAYAATARVITVADEMMRTLVEMVPR